MRRILLAALAALSLWAACADARVAVVIDRSKNHGTAAANTFGSFNWQAGTDLTWALVRSCLDRYNPGSYDVYRSQQVQTSNIAAGRVNVNGTVKQYSAVIWVGTRLMSGLELAGGTESTPGCYPCSLTAVNDGTKMATVPQLFIEAPLSEQNFGMQASTSCSTGFNGSGGNETYDPGRQGPGVGGSRAHILGNMNVWASGPQAMMAVPATKNIAAGTAMGAMPNGIDTSTVDGGFRIVIAGDGSNWVWYGSNGKSAANDVSNDYGSSFPPAWRDSLYSPWALWNLKSAGSTYIGADTAGYGRNVKYGDYITAFPGGSYGIFVADKLMRNVTGGTTLTFCHWGSAEQPDIGGDTFSGATTAFNRRIWGDPEMVYAAIAHFDSVTSFAVLGSAPNRAVRMAVQVSGVARRGSANSAAGIAPHDSTVFYRTADSLNVLGVPIIYGVCVDSLEAYQSQVNYLKTLSNSMFAVERWSGTALSVRAALDSLRNVVGITRTSTTLMGGLNGWAASELKFPGGRRASVVFSLARMDSGGKDSLALVTTTSVDSIAWVLAVNGYTGVSQDAEADSALTGPWDAEQKSLPLNSYYGIRPPQGVLMGLTFPGFNPRRAVMGNGRDVVGVNDSSFCAHYMNRSMWGISTDFWQPPTDRMRVFNRRDSAGVAVYRYYRPWFGEPEMTGTISAKARYMTGTNLVRITAASMGGGTWGANSPNRPGFYQVKYTVNAVKAVNVLAGRTLIAFTSADQIGPYDIRR